VLTMPVLQVEGLPPGRQTALDACPPQCVGKAERWSLTAEGCGGNDGLLQVYVLTSVDGISYDTQPAQVLQVQCQEGCCVRETCEIHTIAAFAKVVVYNVSPESTVSEIAVWATLKA
jgi:hypothetical protein